MFGRAVVYPFRIFITESAHVVRSFTFPRWRASMSLYYGVLAACPVHSVVVYVERVGAIIVKLGIRRANG